MEKVYIAFRRFRNKEKDPKLGRSTETARVLKKRRHGLWLGLSFSSITMTTWTITCILCCRPINFLTYYDHEGRYTKRQYEQNDWVRKVVKTVLSILSAGSIPVTSSVCTKAAAAYCQMYSDHYHRSWTMRQTLALADKGWSELGIHRRVIWSDKGVRVRSFPL